MLEYARAGDTVVVTAIDKPGRSVAEVTRTIADLADFCHCRSGPAWVGGQSRQPGSYRLPSPITAFGR